MTGDAFTLVSPEEATELAAIERAIGKRLPRITVPGFDYAKAPAERFEVPLAERIAAIRARKAEDRKRAKEKAERRAANEAAQGRRPAHESARFRRDEPKRPSPRHPAPPGHGPQPRRERPHAETGVVTPFGRRSR
jgi:ATP-dependent RNA helicase RhlE